MRVDSNAPQIKPAENAATSVTSTSEQNPVAKSLAMAGQSADAMHTTGAAEKRNPLKRQDALERNPLKRQDALDSKYAGPSAVDIPDDMGDINKINTRITRIEAGS